MIARLSGLLRHTLEEAAESEVPVREELDMLERYLEILEIRFQGKLETSLAFEPGVGDALVPNLILQPLAENAVKHGTGRSPGPGWISVEIRRDGDHLVCAVTDSGASRAPEPDGTSGGGFGLRHTRERLSQLYGSRGSLELRPTDEGGTTAEIRIPYHIEPVSIAFEDDRRGTAARVGRPSAPEAPGGHPSTASDRA